MILFVVLLVTILAASSVHGIVASGQKDCTCGFFDDETQEFFTDSIITYFNETSLLPNDFIAEEYVHKYEKDWNAIYREGASTSNVNLSKSDSLQLFVQPPDGHHLVNGGSIRTTRRDIQYGSFRTFIKSPQRSFSGSAMSMMLRYNESETTELSVMNQNDASEAWIGTFVNNEFTTRDLGVNFTQLRNSAVANHNYTGLSEPADNRSINPWEYTEYRVDWTKDYVSFYVSGNLTRQVSHRDNAGMPSVPTALFLKHWSTGNRFSMQGPPRLTSIANVGWVRMFFNSSSMLEVARNDLANRCYLSDACSVSDAYLRGSTSYEDVATQVWRQEEARDTKRMPALWVSVGCLALSTFLIIHTLIRRSSQAKNVGHGNGVLVHAPQTTDPIGWKEKELYINENLSTNFDASLTDCHPVSRPPSSKTDCGDDLAIERAEPVYSGSELGGSTPGGPSRAGSLRFDSRATTPQTQSLFAGTTANNTREQLYSSSPSMTRLPPLSDHESQQILATTQSDSAGPENKIRMETVTESALPAPRMKSTQTSPRQRIDHLAGLTALCSIFVTVMHFGLTFVPAIVIPGAPQHATSEYWAQKIVAPFLLNQMWLGVFFTTSVRFLTAPYLRKGKMEDIAKAAVRRTPRLMIPVASIALLEYFLIDIGATKYLRYIPSITWSTWPYVTRYDNFGQFISEMLELVYLVPNATPQITLHYCTGVLWTIAVQLQGTWLVLLGAVVVYEMKTPWKRMVFYAFCIVNHWYANSWGTYLWLGLLLTDLDVTYKWKICLSTRPFAKYSLLSFFWLCVIIGFGVNIMPNWVDFNFATLERGIHPDSSTGEPIINTENAGYPAYFTPRLNGLLFAGGMQAVVELSSAVQWLLSTTPLLILFPHIFTIYLLHGLVFWTWGSWLLVFLATRGFNYTVNVAIVGVTSYAILFCCLPIVTPILEATGKDITALIWVTAQEKSPPRRATLFPFPSDLLTGRAVNKANGEPVDVEIGRAALASKSLSPSKGSQPSPGSEKKSERGKEFKD